MWYKVKKIYQWSNLVRPKWESWVYDFRGKSVSDFTNQWWSSWSMTTIDSNWITIASQWNDKYDSVLYCPIDISWANSIYIKWKFHWTSWSWAWWPNFWLHQLTSRDSWGRFDLGTTFNNNSWTTQSFDYCPTWWSPTALFRQAIKLSTWDYTMEATINFSTWVALKKVTWPTSFEQNVTLNATQIADIKTFKYIMQAVWYWIYQYHYISSLEFAIS